MNSTTQKQTSLKILLACLVLLVTQITTQSYAREMQPGSDAFYFSTYMIDAFYSEGEECEEKLLVSPTIGWLCAAFPLGEHAFEQRWDAYLSALPEGYNIVAVSPWGDIRYEEDESVFYGKVYDLNDGRLVVGYDQSDRGREIRLGFSSNANQAASTQRQVMNQMTSEMQNQAFPQTQAMQTVQAAPVQAAQQYTQVQAAPVQQQPVFLTQAETRAREIAQAAAAQQQAAQAQQAYNQPISNQQVSNQQTGTYQSYDSQTAQTQNQVQNQLSAPRAYATPTAQNSTAMANATATTLATSTVMNAPQQATNQAVAPLATTSAMSNATATTLATSAVVNASTTNKPTAPLATQNLQAVASQQAVQPVQTPQRLQPVQVQVQTAPQAKQINTAPVAATPTNTQEVMALAQSSEASNLGASAILDVFREKGLSVTNAKPMTTKDYGFAPVLASEGLFFRIGDCTSCIGRIFSFDRPEDVAMMEVYYSLEAQATDVIFSQDNVLLQFFSTPKELAEEYITELKALN